MDGLRNWSWCLVLGVMLVAGAPMFAQSPPDPAVEEVRRTLDAARKDFERYRTEGGVPGSPQHPALKWEAALWAYRERSPRTEAAALATAEAVRLLVRAELWDRAHARVESVAFDDRAWERLATPIYDEAIARKDLPYTIATLSRVAAASATSSSSRSAVLVVLGRAYRRHGDNAAATRSLEAAKSASPGTLYAEEADGVLYEIKYLSVGVQAPAVAGQTRNAGPIDPAGLRGKPVVLVFWGST